MLGKQRVAVEQYLSVALIGSFTLHSRQQCERKDAWGLLLEREMNNTILLAFILSLGMAGMAQTSYAATNEPAAMSSDQTKVKPVKKPTHHKHEHHSKIKSHKAVG
jgi:hypothetical protein